MKKYLIPHRLDEYKDFHDTDGFDDFFWGTWGIDILIRL